MVLERAVEADFGAVVALANVAYRGGGEAAGWTSEAELIAGERLTEARLREDLAAKPGAWLLVCREEAGGAVVGTVWMEPAAGEGVWYLGLLTVQPEMQDRGLGRELLGAAEEFARERGAGRVRMTVVNVRDTLLAWYERRGYRRTGKREAFPYGDARVGRPLRGGLEFVVLEKEVGARG
jgi:ribosomal protein S18 acetylase RimI-like enzyme